MPASNSKEDERNGDPLECDNKIVTWKGEELHAVDSTKFWIKFLIVDDIKNWKNLEQLELVLESFQLTLNAAKDCLEPADIQKAEGILKAMDNRLEELNNNKDDLVE